MGSNPTLSAIESFRSETLSTPLSSNRKNAWVRGVLRGGLSRMRTVETRIRAWAGRNSTVFSVREFGGSLSPSIRLTS